MTSTQEMWNGLSHLNGWRRCWATFWKQLPYIYIHSAMENVVVMYYCIGLRYGTT